VTQCRTILIRGLLLGDDTPYHLGPVSGLGIPDAKSYDVTRGHADGDVGQNDYYQPRPLLVPITIGPPETTTIDEAWDRWDTFEIAWTKSNIDLPLVITLPGRVWTFLGRPRGAIVDDTRTAVGDALLRIQASFRCLDPTRY
jgi:hypothetical protein